MGVQIFQFDVLSSLLIMVNLTFQSFHYIYEYFSKKINFIYSYSTI